MKNEVLEAGIWSVALILQAETDAVPWLFGTLWLVLTGNRKQGNTAETVWPGKGIISCRQEAVTKIVAF